MSGEVKDIDKEVVISILTAVRTRRARIGYGEMAKDIEARTGTSYSPHVAFNHPLGRIQDACVACGLPSLPVMVVTAGMVPGSGFIDYYRSLHPDDGRADKQIIKDEQNACRDCRDWQSLLDYYGIDWELPEARDVREDEKREKYVEGAARYEEKVVKEVARDAKARAECLRKMGTRCAICGFDSEAEYGVPGIIHVHHKHPVAEGMRETDPTEDLIPVCPNCHAVLHSKPGGGCYTPDEVRAMMRIREGGQRES
jgi:hypothetical protein